MPDSVRSCTVHYPVDCYAYFSTNSNCSSILYNYATKSYEAFNRRIGGLKNCQNLNSVTFYSLYYAVFKDRESLDLTDIKAKSIYLTGSISSFNSVSGNSCLLNVANTVETFSAIRLKLTKIPSFANGSTPKNIDLSSNNISDISSVANLTTLQTLNLSNNYVSDLSSLLGLISENNVTSEKSTDLIELNLSNNSLDGYSVADNITALLKLHKAGLQKVTITGNNFSANEVNELINGKTVTENGVTTTYAGFGSGNVIN